MKLRGIVASLLFVSNCSATIIGRLDIVGKLDGLRHVLKWKLDEDRSRIDFDLLRYVPVEQDLSGASKARLSTQFRSLPAEWAALAFPSGDRVTMRGMTDYIFAWNVGDGFDCEVSDRFSRVSALPLRDDENGGNDDVIKSGAKLFYEKSDGCLIAQCSFYRTLDTGDALDFALKNETITIGFAYGKINSQGELEKHVKTVSSHRLNFWDGQQLDNGRRSNLVDALFWHGAAMIIAWLLLMLPATYLARYFKALIPSWFSIHWKAQTLAFVTVLAALVAAVWDSGLILNSWHTILGLVIGILMIAQVLFGYISNKLWFPGKTPTFWADKIHWYTGRILLISGVVNIILGLFLYRDRQEMLYHGSSGTVWILIFVSLGLCVMTHVSFIIYCEVFLGQQHEHLLLDSIPDETEKLLDGDIPESEDTAEKNCFLRPPSLFSGSLFATIIVTLSAITVVVLIAIC